MAQQVLHQAGLSMILRPLTFRVLPPSVHPPSQYLLRHSLRHILALYRMSKIWLLRPSALYRRSLFQLAWLRCWIPSRTKYLSGTTASSISLFVADATVLSRLAR